MKMFIRALIIIMAATLSSQGYAETAVDKGMRLMKQNDARPVFQKLKALTTLEIYSSSGRLKYSKSLMMAAYTKNMGTKHQNEMYLSSFISPPDDRGNSYLAYNYKDKADLKYLYLKGLRKVKKVTGADTKLSFFGSDFTNGDMGKPDIRNWTYRFLGDTMITFKGKKFDCYMVESKPKTSSVKRDYGYGRKVTYLEKSTRLTLKLEYFDLNMTKIKELRLLSFIKKKNIKGQLVYYETGLLMKNVRTGSKTKLLFTKMEFEAAANIKAEYFSVRYLKQRWW